MKGLLRMAGEDTGGELNAHKFNPGDYGYDPFVKLWYAMTPNGHLANLGSHLVTVNEDATITVSPSILVNNSDGPVWHGYLENGVWREC